MNNVKNIKIAAVGDSITFGYPYTPGQSWFNRAAGRLNISHVNSGVNGDTTEGMASRFGRDVLRHQPTHVIIMGGTNDAYLGSDVASVMDNIRYMAERALEDSIVPIIGLPIPCNDLAEELLLGQYRKEIRSYAAGAGLDVIDFHAAMADSNGTKIKAGLHCDGIHPNEDGYSVMAAAAVKFLVEKLMMRESNI